MPANPAGAARPTALTFEDRLAVASVLVARMAEAGLVRGDRLRRAAIEIATYGSLTKDGRELGRDLYIYEGWRCGDKLCAALDAYGPMLRERLDELEQRWAAEHDVTPRFAIGERVAWLKVAGEDNIGTVVGFVAGARYLVVHERSAASLAPVRHEVNFEDCRAVGETAAAASWRFDPRNLPKKVWTALSGWLSLEVADFAMKSSLWAF